MPTLSILRKWLNLQRQSQYSLQCMLIISLRISCQLRKFRPCSLNSEKLCLPRFMKRQNPRWLNLTPKRRHLHRRRVWKSIRPWRLAWKSQKKRKSRRLKPKNPRLKAPMGRTKFLSLRKQNRLGWRSSRNSKKNKRQSLRSKRY